MKRSLFHPSCGSKLQNQSKVIWTSKCLPCAHDLFHDVVPDLLISPLKAFWKIDVISLKERGSFINIIVHASMFRVESLPAIRTLDFFLAMVPFSFVLP